MAKLISPLNIGPNGNSFITQLNIAEWNTGVDTLTQIHIKTNVPASVDLMMHIEAIGYNFGAAQGIRTTWSFLVSSNALHNIDIRNVYPGMSATRVYISSDGFICLQATPNGTSYYMGFVLNAYLANRYADREIKCTSIVGNNTTGNHF